ncbi:aldo/keto reductase [Salinicoccus cyprini]|uniref:Aldo/keto reductase n=2 Tax=Salinicoccus cyprini TaxID=2493691 RepID=A0A558AVH9_9STAP|nr:aldo/keto reductase [Salinicoccus cyprini]
MNRKDEGMERIKIGDTNIEASRIALGTWAMGGFMWQNEPDEKEAIRTVHEAFDQGINMIDTAPDYGLAKSETFIGKALQESDVKREDIVLACKPGIDWTNQGDVYRDMRPERVEEEVDNTLKRLKTDYIDLYQVHWRDKEVPMAEMAGMMKQLYDKGKIRAIGVTNFTPREMDEFREESPLHVTQNQFNMFQRGQRDCFAYGERHQMTGLAWAPMAHGMLTGKMDKSTTFAEEDIRHSHPMYSEEQFTRHMDALEDLKAFAMERNKSMPQLAIRWVLSQPGLGIALWGARKPEQLKDVEGTSNWILDETELKEIDDILKRHIDDLESNYLEHYAPPHRSEL